MRAKPCFSEVEYELLQKKIGKREPEDIFCKKRLVLLLASIYQLAASAHKNDII
jgi:hypothetical protein